MDLLDMDASIVWDLLSCIDTLEAHELLLAIKASDYPLLKHESKTKTHRQLSKLATPNILMEEPKALTMEQLAGVLNGGR